MLHLPQSGNDGRLTGKGHGHCGHKANIQQSPPENGYHRSNSNHSKTYTLSRTNRRDLQNLVKILFVSQIPDPQMLGEGEWVLRCRALSPSVSCATNPVRLESQACKLCSGCACLRFRMSVQVCRVLHAFSNWVRKQLISSKHQQLE